MLTLRTAAKGIFTLILGKEQRPRRILRGIPSGYRIIVSPEENLGYLLGTTEPHLQRIIRQYVSAGQTVYDIGANMGYVSLSLSKQVGATGSVIAFEPVPENLTLLRSNVEINRISNIRVFDYAASDTCGEAEIRIPENLSTSSMVWHAKDTSAAKLTIKTVTIDKLLGSHEIPPPQFVKIDVEGAEGLVLGGMQETIAAFRPVIFLECSDAGRETSWTVLRGMGYRCQSAMTQSPVSSFEAYQHSDFLWLPSLP